MNDNEQLAAEFAAKINELAPSPTQGRLEPSPERIDAFEQHIGAELPADYRMFLAAHAATSVSATCPIFEPSPCGQEAVVERFYGFLDDTCYGSLDEVSDDAEGAPVVIPIGEGGFGSQLFLILAGELCGNVFFYDAQQRFFWPDEQFHSMYSNLHPDIGEYLRLRAANELPDKPEGMENFYLIANSFTAFVRTLEYWDLDA